MASHGLAVVIGRFQPYHLGHVSLIRTALEAAEHVLVVLGSSFGARTPKNPFTWQEREQMVRATLGASDSARLYFLPVRDYYNEERWVQAVRRGVAQVATDCRVSDGAITLVGHRKDASSAYLDWFPGWAFREVPLSAQIDATALRKVLLNKETQDGGMALISTYVPQVVGQFLRAFTLMPEYATLCKEHSRISAYRKQWEDAPFPPKFVTADALVRVADHVLLVRREGDLGEGLWAIPGGHVEENELLFDCAVRELREETGFAPHAPVLRHALKDVRLYEHPGRSLRGRTFTHAHFFYFADYTALTPLMGNGSEGEPQWVPITRLASMEPTIFEDHFHILDDFLNLTCQDTL